MSELLNDIFCSEQIIIPPMLPNIIKQYCKAAIRTQPYDLLKWSSMYFRALSNGEAPPVKERLEYPPYYSSVGFTRGYLKVIINAFKYQESVLKEDLVKLWRGMALDENFLENMFQLAGFTDSFDLHEFIAVAAGHLTHSLKDTMILLCELFTDDPEGGLAKIPVELFERLYIFLANIDGNYGSPVCSTYTKSSLYSRSYVWGIESIVPTEQINNVIKHMKYWSKRQEGTVMPFNIRHALCPPLNVSVTEDD